MFVLLFFYYLLSLIKQRKYCSILKYIIILSFFEIVFSLYKIKHFSCKYWVKGLNSTEIDNISKDFPCKINIPIPHSCYLKEMGLYVDLTAKFRPTCASDELLKKEKEILFETFKKLKFSNESNMTHFGLPITNQNDNGDTFGTILNNKGKKNFYNYINKNIILMDLYNKNKSKYYPEILQPEIEIIFKNNKGKISFNIKKKEDIIKLRKKLINKNKKLLYKNILIFFFDTLSRAHFHRKFNKTIHFLSQFSKYEPNFKKKNLTIFEYFKYHSVGSNTDPNIKAAYYGTKIKKKRIHFSNYFKNNGFIIGRTSSYCEKEIVYNNNNNKVFIHSMWDHEGLSIPCLKGIYHGFFCKKLLYCSVKKCLFGKQIFQYSLEYLEAFWSTYIQENKMFLFQSFEGHEPTGEVIGYIDDYFYNFLNKFYSKGWFKGTAIIIFSDHGQHLNGPLYFTKSMDFFYERTLPLLLIIIPNDEKLYKNNLYEKIKYNQQILVTPYDIHETFLNLALGNKKYKKEKNLERHGNSLFTKLNYKIRYCHSSLYPQKIKLCNCKSKTIKN